MLLLYLQFKMKLANSEKIEEYEYGHDLFYAQINHVHPFPYDQHVRLFLHSRSQMWHLAAVMIQRVKKKPGPHDTLCHIR